MRHGGVITNNKPTGTNSPTGIGRAAAHQFAQNGAKAVYICDFDPTYLATHQRELNSLYPSVDVHVRQFDAASEPAVEAIVDEAISSYGRLDVFFANAGIVGVPMRFGDVEGDDFLRTLQVNVLGFVLSSVLLFYILYVTD